MANRSLNKVMLIGNLTRDPELRYTPAGTAVCSFGVATNRSWNTDTGEKREETEFHRIVAWNKLAELCSQLCSKGRKVFVEGRLSTRSWTSQDGTQRTVTEIVIEDMILLDSRRPVVEGVVEEAALPKEDAQVLEVQKSSQEEKDTKQPKKARQKETSKAKDSTEEKAEPTESETSDVNPDDIPF